MPGGAVKWFNSAKGYGFISQDGGGDVFVHVSKMEQSSVSSLSEGQRVEFNVSDSAKGQSATDLKVDGSSETVPTDAEGLGDASADGPSGGGGGGGEAAAPAAEAGSGSGGGGGGGGDAGGGDGGGDDAGGGGDE